MADDLLDSAGIETTVQSTTSQSLLVTFLKQKGLEGRYVPFQRISQGPSKEVWIVESGAHQHQGEKFVAKLLNMALMSQHERVFAISEVKCLSECKHPNIIKYVEDYELNESVLLIMELATGGDLYTQLRARNTNKAFFKRDEALVVFCQIFLAIDYVHSLKMLHRDIKAENIFVTAKGVLKVGDFGFTRKYDQTLSGTPGETFCGTPHYLSPEICNHQPYGKKSDLWSVGVVLYEVVALQRPFTGKNLAEIMGNIVKGNVPPLLTLCPTIGTDIAALCHSLLSQDPEMRPSIQRIFRLPFIRYALSDLRGAVSVNNRIPLSDRTAMASHVETVLGGVTLCTAATIEGISAELVLTASDVVFQKQADHSAVVDLSSDSLPPPEVLETIPKLGTTAKEDGTTVIIKQQGDGRLFRFVLRSQKVVTTWVSALTASAAK